MKGSTGYGLHFSRSIPLQIATDNNKKIESCSRITDNPQGTTVGIWSDNCSDFAAKGWASKDSCVKDGRWHHVYTNDDNGIGKSEDFEKIVDYIHQGAVVRVGIPPETGLGHDALSELCVSTARQYGKLVCLGGARGGVPDWHKPEVSGVGGVVFFSDGRLVYNYPSSVVRVSMKWYVKF